MACWQVQTAGQTRSSGSCKVTRSRRAVHWHRIHQLCSSPPAGDHKGAGGRCRQRGQVQRLLPDGEGAWQPGHASQAQVGHAQGPVCRIQVGCLLGTTACLSRARLSCWAQLSVPCASFCLGQLPAADAAELPATCGAQLYVGHDCPLGVTACGACMPAVCEA